jgi:hypothetical protein
MVTEDLVHCVSGMTDVAVVVHDAQSDALSSSADYRSPRGFLSKANRIVVRFRLVENASGQCIWSRRFEGPADQWFHLAHIAAVAGNEIASWRGVIIRAEAAKARMLPPRRSTHINTMSLRSSGERQRDPAGAAATHRHLERSLELEPENARGWLLLWHILERPFILFGEPFSQEQGGAAPRQSNMRTLSLPMTPRSSRMSVANVLAQAIGWRAHLARPRRGDRTDAGGRLSPCANAFATIKGDMRRRGRIWRAPTA